MKCFAHHTEVRPCGMRGLEHEHVDLGDCLAAPRGEVGLTIWEPLHTKAPGPQLTLPWCCYVNTVIFYCSPFVKRGPHPWRSRDRWHWQPGYGSYVEWDRLEHRLQWHDVVRFADREFEVQGGHVRWTGPPGQRRQWWMWRYARERKGGGHGRLVEAA